MPIGESKKDLRVKPVIPKTLLKFALQGYKIDGRLKLLFSSEHDLTTVYCMTRDYPNTISLIVDFLKQQTPEQLCAYFRKDSDIRILIATAIKDWADERLFEFYKLDETLLPVIKSIRTDKQIAAFLERQAEPSTPSLAA